MQAAGLFEREIKPPEVARRLRVSRKSVHQWHQLWRDGGTAGPGPWPRVARVDHDVVCLRAVRKSWPCPSMSDRPRMAGWRARRGRPPGWSP
ncbi:helix-turn-helix domain-containing protein [Streptomyces sp. NPDC001297]|uniref:helix-turn-helix domain-containing protein n=1 Tax=Streptomyces sp. NPDC001297 TaxID=3364559 RepID=UPI0036A26B79